MKTWEKSDIGKIILYKNNSMGDEVVAISDICKDISDRIYEVRYSTKFDSKPFPLTLQKEQEKKYLHSLEKIGDWYYLMEIPESKKEEFKKISPQYNL